MHAIAKVTAVAEACGQQLTSFFRCLSPTQHHSPSGVAVAEYNDTVKAIPSFQRKWQPATVFYLIH
jgi:hypothetical protein